MINIGFLTIQFWDVLDIGLVAILFYYIMMLLRGTRATQIILGIVSLGVIYLLATWTNLSTIAWLIAIVWKVGVIALVIVFQPELRGALAKIGAYGISGIFNRKRDMLHMAEEIATAAVELSKKGFGGLMVIEREVGLRSYIETGKALLCRINSDILVSIFYPNAPLHDGAVIIRDENIVAAGCALPLTQDPAYDYLIGMRHRAAVGISSESDSIVVVVSEETGSISICKNSVLHSDIPHEKVHVILSEMIN